RACAPGEHVGAVERDGSKRDHRIVQPDALPDPLDLRLETQPRRQRDRIASLNRTREGVSLRRGANAADGSRSTLQIGSLHYRVDIPVERTKMGPIAAVAGGIEVDMTGERAFEAVDRAMHGTGCAGLRNIEADIITVAVD